MKKIIIIFVLLILSACSSNSKRHPSSIYEEELNVTYGKDISDLEELIEQSLVWREKSIAFFNSHKEKLTSDSHLSHEEMLETFQSAKDYILIREKFLSYVERFDLDLSENVSIKIEPNKKTKIKTYTVGSAEQSYPDQPQTSRVIYLDPNDKDGQEMVLKLKLALTSAVLLYDNYMLGIYPYEKSWKMRKLLNTDNEDLKNELQKITDNFFNLKNRMEFYKSAHIHKKLIAYQNETKLEIFKDEKYFDQLVDASSVYRFMTTGKDIDNQPFIVRAMMDRVFDSARFLRDSFSYYSSKVFGNVVGLVSFRDGKLKNLSPSEKTGITSKLKALDIMLEKTPFRLTDRFIPGYYGHVAIWTGTEEELKELGVWDVPVVQKYHEQIRSGHHIVEALRPGVQINTLEHFLNIDDLLVLRDENLTIDQKKEFIVRAFEQIGKSYDFNFDVETDKKIVCSEIVYVVFHDIAWPTKKAMGRFTISPDNVANKAVNNGPLVPVLMYKDGGLQDETKLPELLLNNLESE
jgi:hypothetical protein